MKKFSIVLMSGVIASVMALAGCSNSSGDASKASSSSAMEDAAVDAEKTEEEKTDMTEKNDQAIMVVSFGTSYNDSRDITIGAIEGAITKAFPDYSVRRAFTSQIIIDKLAERDGLKIDNVEQALDRAVADGVKTLVVQPTHLMNGYEYTDLANALEDYKDKFDKLALAEPLLTSDEDFKKVISAITAETEDYDDGDTAICFMGHGTEADSNSVYGKMQEMLVADGYKNCFIATVEATPSLEDFMALAKDGGYKKVVLEPLMVVAGDHANNDMAGDEEDSWKTQLESAGFEVECILRGLGEFADVQNIYVEHTQAAIDSLK